MIDRLKNFTELAHSAELRGRLEDESRKEILAAMTKWSEDAIAFASA